MELFQTNEFYIFHKGEYSLWCSRTNGNLEVKTAWDLGQANDPVCLGYVHGIVGKVQCFPDSDSKLLVIESCSLVGHVWDHQPIYKINEVGLLNLGPHESEIHTHPCPNHSPSVAFSQINESSKARTSSKQHKVALAKTWGTIKSATKTLKSTTVQAAQRIGKDGKDTERCERRLLEEVQKLFSQSESFYFSPNVDLTNSIQRLGYNLNREKHTWRSADDRFFWNKFLVDELISLQNPSADAWIVPVLHGYIHIDTIPVDIDGCPEYEKPLTIMLISRRSRYRAGTRYKKRGVDEHGNVANYVETEQYLLYGSHIFSFVQVRGSVPVYWSQPGFKYRPPPQLDRGIEETCDAFRRHFQRELSIYDQQCIVSLIEQSGKEKIIADTFMEHIVLLNDPRLIYVTFDFHEHCRGMRFENVSRLVNGLEEILRDMRYSWVDSHGIICQQSMTFRINCMDCLDRTNVVQTAFAKIVLEGQLSKLGILPPEGSFWPALKHAFNAMWANNGDVLSRQYAGTNALKGDYTRTGERRLAGMMKDGMNSANRYYVNRFKDNLKQLAIDLMLGQALPEDISSVLGGSHLAEENEEVILQTADRVWQVIEDCRNQYVGLDEIVVGSWGLVDAHPSSADPVQVDMDTIMILTREFLYIVQYDEDLDQVKGCKKYHLSDLVKIEVGPEEKLGPSLTSPAVAFFKSPKRDPKSTFFHVMRIHFTNEVVIQFRSTKLRFFNNIAVPICNTEDMNESLKAIAETIHVTMDISGLTIPYNIGQLNKLLKNPTKSSHLEMSLLGGFPRNPSEGQLSVLKSAGNKALSSVASHFARFKLPVRKPQSNSADENSTTATMLGASESDSDLEVDSNCSSIEDNDLLHGLMNEDLFSEPAGILFIVNKETVAKKPDLVQHHSKPKPKVLLRCVSAACFNGKQKPINVTKINEGRMVVKPEILISGTESEQQDNGNLRSFKRLSHSSENMEPGSGNLVTADTSLARASSEKNLLNSNTPIKNSKSEQSLKNNIGSQLLSSIKFNIPQGKINIGFIPTSSSATANPLSFFTKGMQNLGANLDPRKILDSLPKKEQSPSTKPIQITQKHCATRIIAL